ncbi:Ltp family lipoprotein [Demequina rhizosphaerae]|uniref:Ltp family lipoprotein n=1 Tax=Demequina rhizosphaerae TaxID=1638985 RepID=UPI0007864BBF|nr:Ltp family lipoprotein [Demequina rhizosphaerae]
MTGWLRRHRLASGVGAALLVAGIATTVAFGAHGAPAARGADSVGETARATAAPTREAERALSSAQTYLESFPFSKSGLFEQLTSAYADGYAKEAARWAVETVGVDWDVEAFEVALDYLDHAAFSRAGLVDQLTAMHGGQFTRGQAEHAVRIVGADWRQQAIEVAREYLAFGSYGRDALVERLSSDQGARFTRAQAEYAVDTLGL